MSDIRPEFQVHLLNRAGVEKANDIAEGFSKLVDWLEKIVPAGRYQSLMKTNLEQACWFAKKGMASAPENQVSEEKTEEEKASLS